MNPEKVTFGFFIVLALTLNVGFVYGDIDNPNHHHWDNQNYTTTLFFDCSKCQLVWPQSTTNQRQNPQRSLYYLQ